MPAAIFVSPMSPERWQKASLRDMRFAVVLFLAGRLFAQSADQLEFFEKKVRPILAANCYACHGQKMQMSGLDFSSAEGLAKVVSPGASAESRLYKAVSYAEKIKMP